MMRTQHSSRPLSRSTVAFLVTMAIAATAHAQTPSASAPAASTAPGGPPTVRAGNGTIYVAGYPHSIYVIDESTEKVTDTIPLQIGTPRSMVLSPDHKRFFVLNNEYEKLEIVDIPAKKSLDVFTISEGNSKSRWMSYAVAPSGAYAVIALKTATKQVDRFVIDPPRLVQYDFKTRKIVRTIPWPDDEPRERANMIFSPDGKYLYLFSDETIVYDTAAFKQVDKWELARLSEDGYGRLDMGPMDARNDDPGFLTGLFTMQDPVQKRQLMGVGRIDLVGKKLDFHAIGPATSLRSFWLAPDRKHAYALKQEIADYEFWTFDLVNYKVEGRHPFAGRPRMDVGVSTNGKILYIFTAGNTIDLFDAATYTHLRTITLDGDMETPLFVVPASGSGGAVRQTSGAGAP